MANYNDRIPVLPTLANIDLNSENLSSQLFGDEFGPLLHRTIGKWLLTLPLEITPVVGASKFGLSAERRAQGARAYRTALGPYELSDLEVSLFHEQSRFTRDEFGDWVKSLNLEEDNEIGGEEGTYKWVLENDELRTEGSPYQTVIFKDRETHQIVATASFVHDDRGEAHRLCLDKEEGYLGIWGFFQVRRELRGFRLGSIISKYVNDFIYDYVDEIGESKTVYLFTSVPAAMKIYGRLGFTQTDEVINVPGFNMDEILFKKTFSPRAFGAVSVGKRYNSKSSASKKPQVTAQKS